MFVCSFVKCVKTILYNCLVSFNFQCVRLCVRERHKHIKKKNYRHEHRRIMSSSAGFGFFFCFRYVHNWDKIAPWFFFEVWALLISFEVFFFWNKSVWRQICVKLEVGLDVCIVVSTEFCKFVYTKFTSPIRLFFSLFPPFIRLNETHSSSFSRLFLLFFMCVCVTMSLPDDCQRGHMARNTCADNAKKKLIQEQQEAWFFLVYLFCGLNRDRSRLNQEKDCWFSGPVQMANRSTRGWMTLLTVKLRYSKLPRQQQQKNVLTHAHMLTTGMCTAGVKKKNYIHLVCVCVCVCVRACVRVCMSKYCTMAAKHVCVAPLMCISSAF